jgi:hypothetical protein
VTTPAPGGGGTEDSALVAAVRSAASGGFEMSKKTRAYLEPRFGADFSSVRIHTDAQARRLANRLGARAFTYGRHNFFNAGVYQPDSPAGMQLLAHELTHTISRARRYSVRPPPPRASNSAPAARRAGSASATRSITSPRRPTTSPAIACSPS